MFWKHTVLFLAVENFHLKSLHFDDNTVVAGALIDEEILAEVNEDKSLEAGLNNNDEIEDVLTVTRKDARQSSCGVY